MQAYQLEYFADALKSCLTESDGYVHRQGKQYYHIRPRHPFAFKHDYWQPIPPPIIVAKTGQDISDIVLRCVSTPPPSPSLLSLPLSYYVSTPSPPTLHIEITISHPLTPPPHLLPHSSHTTPLPPPICSLSILIAAVVGLVTALWRLKLFAWCSSKV